MSGVDFPMSLVEAHEAGELVIFVGAGASIPWPSELPSFVRLVETIRDESNLEREIGSLDGQQLEEVLGTIADKYRVDVHQRIHELTSNADSRPSRVHTAIANLASASQVRVITTNYDRHLSTSFNSLGTKINEYCAPALPVGDNFTGIVYIHGRLDQDPHTLIATDDDFGHAYLTDAWAARFLDRMFPSHPVLFVGYSHKDTIMKYLARGLGGRSAKRYVLTDEPDSNLWQQLGITPIACSHAQIAPALTDWAARASGGLLGHRARVKALVANQDPTPVPETMSYLETILANKNTVRFFTEDARGLLWLQWAAARPEFATLFIPSSDVDPTVTRDLARWFAQNYIADDELSDAAIQIVAEAPATPGPDLLFEVTRRLASQDWPLPERIRRWLLVVTENAESQTTTSLLDSILRGSSIVDDPDTALFLFDYLTEPRIRPRHGYFGGTFEPVGRDSDITLGDLWQQAFRPALNSYASRLLEIADRHLRRADLQLTIAGEADRLRPSHFRTAVDIIEEPGLSGPLGFLVDTARECTDHLLAAGDSDVKARLDSWAASGVALLQRLAVNGWNSRTDKTASEKFDWLHSNKLLTKYELRSESMQFVLDNVGSVESESIATLVADVLEYSKASDYKPYWPYRLLTLIHEAVPDNDGVSRALSDLVAVHPEVVADPPSAPAKKVSAWTTPPPTNTDELHRLIDEERDSIASALIACETESSGFDDQRRWDELTAAISSTIREWPEDGFSLLNAVGPGHSGIALAVVRGWGMTEHEDHLAARILTRLSLDPPMNGLVVGVSE